MGICKSFDEKIVGFMSKISSVFMIFERLYTLHLQMTALEMA